MPMAVPTLAHPVALEALVTRCHAGSGSGVSQVWHTMARPVRRWLRQVCSSPFTSRVAQVGMLQPTNSSRRCRSWSPVEHTNTCPSPAANPTTSLPLHENKGVIACGEICQALGLPCCPRHQLAACVRVSSLAGRACRVGLEFKHKVNRQLGWTWLTVGQAAGRSVVRQTETGKPDGYSRSMEQSS